MIRNKTGGNKVLPDQTRKIKFNVYCFMSGELVEKPDFKFRKKLQRPLKYKKKHSNNSVQIIKKV